jgi:perosamine synthetase
MTGGSRRLRIPLSAPDVGDDEVAAVSEVLRSGRLSLGPKVGEFERALARFSASSHAKAVSSGTAALDLCLRGLGIGAGDEVITSPFSFVASASAIVYQGARPVFVDIDPDDLNLDAGRIEAAVTSRTRAILPVHVFGRPANMDAIRDVARRRSLRIVEDACEAIGGEYRGRKLGTLGDAGTYAFYPNKQMTTAEGGAIVTDDDDLARAVVRLRNHGRDPGDSFRHRVLGYNYRLSDLHCALGLVQLAKLDRFLELREGVARRYGERLAGLSGLIVPEAYHAAGRTGWFVYVVRLRDDFTVDDRDRIAAELEERGIGCGKYFPPIHLQPFYRDRFGYGPGDFPIAENAAARTLALPFHNRLRDEQIDEVCDTLAELVGRGSADTPR